MPHGNYQINLIGLSTVKFIEHHPYINLEHTTNEKERKNHEGNSKPKLYGIT